MWLSDKPWDIFVIFYILLWGIGSLKNLTNFSRQAFESHLESRSSAFKFCALSTFPHYTPKGLRVLSQLKIIQLFMCVSQNNSNIWFAVCVCDEKQYYSYLWRWLQFKNWSTCSIKKPGFPRVHLDMCHFMFSHLVWRLDIWSLKDKWPH